jgi:AraC family ethanolamine operon transcriptional activator
MVILLYFSLKVADVSLSKSGHLVPWWLTPHRRSLEIGFAESMAISPKLFARYVRLNSLHRELIRASPQKHSVTMIEMQLGFSEFGRTAGYYRELFGELPSETLDRQPPDDSMRLSDSLR